MASILIVDDEEGLREFLSDALSTQTYEVTTAASVQEALDILNTRTFDLLITDLKMPGTRDGMDLVRRVRAEDPEMEVIVLTPHGSIEKAVEAIKLGAFDFLQKPIGSPDELRAMVARVLEQKRATSAAQTTSTDGASSGSLAHEV